MLTTFITLLFLVTIKAFVFPGCDGGTTNGCPSVVNTSLHWIEQPIDHFGWTNPPLDSSDKSTFKQRYFVNDDWWKPGAPIFFYFGNEDNVELYVNHTGLMWESAPDFHAMLVFAEHRYYGNSTPYEPGTKGCMRFCTTEQALADFAYLVYDLRSRYGSDLPVIGFGGSYGGMLAAWGRMKYPNAFDGVISGSAPIWSFANMEPAYNYNAFDKSVTDDASSFGGATDYCKTNLKSAWPLILEQGQSAEGRTLLQTAFRSCQAIQTEQDAMQIVSWASSVWGTLAMGNYYYESSYLMHGKSLLPAWPVRVACKALDRDFDVKTEMTTLFEAVRESAAVVFNNTGDKTCFDILEPPPDRRRLGGTARHYHRTNTFERRVGKDECVGSWDFQWCTEMVQPFTEGTDEDMFYCPPDQNCSVWNYQASFENCQNVWNVTPRPEWARIGLLGKRIESASNIVFSNGLLDPWHGGGVLQNISDTLLAVLIPNGAHHIDLMFTSPEDKKYPDVLWARAFEREQIQKWIDGVKKRGARSSSKELL